MNTRQKGRKLVKIIIQEFRNELDPGTYEVVGSGVGKDKGDIRVPALNLVIEAKNCETINISQWTKQAEKQGLDASDTALMWRHPKSPQDNPEIRVDIDFGYFLKLLKGNKKPAIENPSRELKYLLQRSIETDKKIIKLIEK